MHAARVLRQRHKQAAAEAGALQEDGSLCAEQRKALEEAFDAADKNGDGVLSAEEYYEIFAAHGLSIDREWIERTIARNDKDGDGGINLEEFVEMNIRTRFSRGRSPSSSGSGTSTVTASSDLHEKARLAFNAYDRNRDGYLTKAELRKTSRKMTDAQIDAVFEKFDRNRDGRLDFEEFKELMESNKKSPPK